MFQFDSLYHFLAMDGHGPWVWVSYGVSLAVMAWLVISPLRRRRAILRIVDNRQRRTAAGER